MRQSKRYLIWAACAAATMTALPAQADMYSCERYSNDASGFISFAAYESWHPKKIVLNSNKGEKNGNKLRFTEKFKQRDGEKLSRITDLLPNNKAIAGLALSGEYMKTGKARYKCKNLSE